MTSALALDISPKCVGWAFDGDGGQPRSGIWKGASSFTPGRAGALFSEWLSNMIRTYKPDIIAAEAAAIGSSSDGFYMNRETAKTLIGMAFLAETIAAAYRLQYREAAVNSCRKTFCGSGWATKEDVRERCRLLGWHVESLDESDAICVWYHVKSKHTKGFQPAVGTPLFSKAGAR
jgi:Holliday junction resolvasome RuvABC endonuclease subunit